MTPLEQYERARDALHDAIRRNVGGAKELERAMELYEKLSDEDIAMLVRKAKEKR